MYSVLFVITCLGIPPVAVLVLRCLGSFCSVVQALPVVGL